MQKIYLFIVLLYSTSLFAQTWQPVGPIQFPVDISGQINGIGRTCQLKYHSSNPQKMYAVTASAGLWISTDEATTWTKTGSDNLPATSCASICIDFTDDNILYLGTGDANYYGGGYGIWKSTDAGQTWNPSNNAIGNRMALEILMSPSDHNVLIAATDDGIWKSIDAGQNWTAKKTGGQFTDMKVNPSNPSIMYAVTMNEFWRSTDMGDTWTQITNGFTGAETLGDGCRIAVSASSPNVVYVGTVKDEGTIFKSTDAGLTFTTKYHNPSVSLTGYDTSGGGQGNYNFNIGVSPTNSDEVYLCSHNVWKSTDGGVNWTQLTNWWATVHTDMHQWLFSPFQPTHLFNINDGGIWFTQDGGQNWGIKSNGLEATECYHAATSPVSPQLASIGTQDNGELFWYNGAWKTNRGGDWGSRMWFDYVGTGKVYYDDGERRNVATQGGAVSVNIPSTSGLKYAFTSVNSNIGVGGHDSLYLCKNISASAANLVWTLIFPSTEAIREVNFASDDSTMVYVITDADHIYRCDNILAANPNFVQLATPGGTGATARICPLSAASQIVYASCGNKVYRSTDKGATWSNYSGTLSAVNIIGLCYDKYSTTEALYLATAKGVFYRDNSQNDWLNYGSGLPSIADIVDLMMYNEGNAVSKVRVAYYGRGVWERGLYNQAAALPYTQFTSDRQVVCANGTIQFTDQTQGNATAWSWNFGGGVPASSIQQNPSVTYTTPGTYTVSLSATNANGSDAEVKYFYVTVVPSAGSSIPVSEGFEGTSFPPQNWTNRNLDGDNLEWIQSPNAGGFANSAHSIAMDNFDTNGSGSRDELWTPAYVCTANYNYLRVRFDVAYARYSGDYYDSLIVLISKDCGLTFDRVYAKGGSDLATAPDTTNAFIPTANQWRTDSVLLGSFSAGENLMIAFQNYGGWGQWLYVDNINLDGLLFIGVEDAINASFSLYPNPNDGKFTLSWKNIDFKEMALSISDIAGKNMLTQAKKSVLGLSSQEISLENVAKGVYFLQIETDKGKTIKQLIVK